MELKHISIVVIEICGKGDNTILTLTNVVFSRDSVYNRIVVDIDQSVISNSTTIFIHHLNSEAVRIVTVFSLNLDGILMFTAVNNISCSSQSVNTVVFEPCEVVRAGRDRIHIGVHHDVQIVRVTHDRIGNQGKNRVREHGNNCCLSGIRLTTGCSLSHANSIVVSRNITVDSFRSFNINGVVSFRDHSTITVPCVNLTTRNATMHVGSQGNETAFADSIVSISQIIGYAVNNRYVIYIDNIRSSVETCLTIGHTIFKQMCNLYNICSSVFRPESFNRLSHTRNSIVRISTILVPLIC